MGEHETQWSKRQGSTYAGTTGGALVIGIVASTFVAASTAPWTNALAAGVAAAALFAGVHLAWHGHRMIQDAGDVARAADKAVAARDAAIAARDALAAGFATRVEAEAQDRFLRWQRREAKDLSEQIAEFGDVNLGGGRLRFIPKARDGET